MVEIEGLTEVPVVDFSKANWWYSKGRRARSTSSTNVNNVSSRSHWWVLLPIFSDTAFLLHIVSDYFGETFTLSV